MIQKNDVYRIAVCDDEPLVLESVYGLACQILQDEKIENTISCYNNGYELLNALKNNLKFDLLLLDVMMPQQDGMELASYLRTNLYEDDIVFFSSNCEMALRGYEVAAKRYLSKPVDPERLREALLHCYNEKQKTVIVIPVSSGIRKVHDHEIRYIETQGRGCRIVLETETLSTGMLISKFESICSARSFVRCHQGFIVNLRFVQEMQTSRFILADGTFIPISKHRIKQVRQTFLSYLSG